MSVAILILVFGLVTLFASAFVVLPLLRSSAAAGPSSRPWLAVAAGLSVATVGLGAYVMLGQPAIAIASLGKPGATDYPGLVATLARSMPDRPGDLEGWSLLARGYLALGNADQSAKAFERAVAIAKEQNGVAPPELLADYGEALAQAASQVTPEAEAVFKEALKEDPKDLRSRIYMGEAAFERGDRAGALEFWKGALADAPPDAEWRAGLLNRVVALTAENGGGAPNPMAMVAQLASRLETNPDDLNGWLMLIRAYSVLGDKQKASAAMAEARAFFVNDAQAQAALSQAAKDNALN
jgi:cytochrome c-type biogenesis protein CcmH